MENTVRHIHILTATLLLATAGPVSSQTYSDHIAAANSLYEAGDYAASAREFAQAFELQSGNVLHWYNAACSWSLAGNTDRALAALEGALKRGYHDLGLLNTDEDLEPLRQDPRWETVVTKCSEAREAYMTSIHAELLEMFEADQADRRGEIDWEEVAPRDEARRARAMELVEAGKLKARDDLVHAAFIFQHGADSTSYRMAHELAMKAVALDSTYMSARWIAAAAKDRYLQSIGLPQIYGTQFLLVDGTWTLEPIDTTVVSDAERARWGVPPLARQRARAAKMNR
jgi:hypothetical protein